jgi:hypothetical protein
MAEFIGLFGFLLLWTDHEEIEHNENQCEHDDGAGSTALALQ